MAEPKRPASKPKVKAEKQTFEDAVDQLVEEEQHDAALRGDAKARDEIMRDVMKRFRQIPLGRDSEMPPLTMPPLSIHPRRFHQGGPVRPSPRSKGYAAPRIRQAKG